jgi:flagellar basal body-associated protein FliL
VLLPKINGNAVHAEAKAEDGGHGEAAASGGHGEKSKAGGESSKGGHGGGKEKSIVPLSTKVLVNVSGTAGTRYLLANISIVGSNASLKEHVEKSDAQLRDVAMSVLGVKTIADIDKPGARNLIRTELVSAFNGVLGDGMVKEIYFTEFAIQ